MIYVDRDTLNIPLSEKIFGHYGDNSIKTVTFEIGENYPDCRYILYLSFSDGSINSVPLENAEGNTAVWTIKAEHIFAAGTAHIQIKAISEGGEIWHSPKAEIEFLHSIDHNSSKGSYTPTLFEKFDSIINMLSSESSSSFITRAEVSELINELFLPLCQRLDGE